MEGEWAVSSEQWAPRKAGSDGFAGSVCLSLKRSHTGIRHVTLIDVSDWSRCKDRQKL